MLFTLVVRRLPRLATSARLGAKTKSNCCRGSEHLQRPVPRHLHSWQNAVTSEDENQRPHISSNPYLNTNAINPFCNQPSKVFNWQQRLPCFSQLAVSSFPTTTSPTLTASPPKQKLEDAARQNSRVAAIMIVFSIHVIFVLETLYVPYALLTPTSILLLP